MRLFIDTSIFLDLLFKRPAYQSAATLFNASAGTAAAGGTVCEPAVVICTPVAAIVAWVATDAAIVSADEYLNRDEFKAKILHDITMQKEELKKQLQNAYTDNFIQYHKALIAKLEATKVKKRVTVKERIHHSGEK